MTEKQKQIIMKLAGDPELLKEFLDMSEAMGTKPVANEATVSLYVMRRHTEDGNEYYHPVVAPRTLAAKPEDYTMIADKSLVALQDTYGAQARMMGMMVGEDPIILTIPERTYNELKEKLTSLVSAIYSKIDKAAEALDGISELAGYHVEVDSVKAAMAAEIVGKMRISGQCLNKDYGIENAHEYVEDKDPAEDETSCGEECPDGEPDCDGCEDYGRCPCTHE